MVLGTPACPADCDGDSDVATSGDDDSAAESEVDKVRDFRFFPKHVLSELEANSEQPLEIIQFRNSLEEVNDHYHLTIQR